MTKQEQKQKVNDFIVQGYELLDKEFTAPSLFKQKIASLFEVWMNDINIFNERYLKGHPLYSSIYTTFFHHTTKKNSPRLMLGHLEALEKDLDYWQELSTEFEAVQPKHDLKREENSVTPIIFISHRTTDTEVADMLKDFLVTTGIPNEYIFCSSLPGNDVAQNIPQEVKEKIANSRVNIAILSEEYYKSAYCLNEAGIIWFQYPKTPAIVVGLPGITPNNMHGFLNSAYKLRNLGDVTDISAIFDAVRDAVGTTLERVSVVTFASQKLATRYTAYLSGKAMNAHNVADPMNSITNAPAVAENDNVFKSFEYTKIKTEIAKALTLYADCLYNPIDLADTQDNKLPVVYHEASKKLRELGAELKAFAETSDEKIPKITRKKIEKAAGYLIGLSNSFTVPYGSHNFREKIELTRKLEEELRTLLGLLTKIR